MGEAREDEVEMLRSMFTEDEMRFPRYPEELFVFEIDVELECPEKNQESNVACTLCCNLIDGYPQKQGEFSVLCDRIRREDSTRLAGDVSRFLSETVGEEMQVLAAIEWVKDHAATYIGQAQTASKKAKSSTTAGPRKIKGFMREWCSFVSLYKDSYISGPNRFEVMTSLARDRGLKVTGMGISGKPGGLVAEGEENDLVEFMALMRTEFFETLNPRGRKLTTRLQERWPLDDEGERFEIALIMDRIRRDDYKSADRAEGKKMKPGEKDRLEKQEADDRTRLESWKASRNGQSMPMEEVDTLLAAGPPGLCTEKGVYNKCGCEDPPTQEEVDAQRLFKDFTIFQGGKEGFEAAYQDAAKIFKDLGRMDGFDCMFAYRFS